MPAVRLVFGGEGHRIKGALLTPFSLSLRNEGRRGESGMREAVDDFIDELLWKRLHNKLMSAGGDMSGAAHKRNNRHEFKKENSWCVQLTDSDRCQPQDDHKGDRSDLRSSAVALTSAPSTSQQDP